MYAESARPAGGQDDRAGRELPGKGLSFTVYSPPPAPPPPPPPGPAPWGPGPPIGPPPPRHSSAALPIILIGGFLFLVLLGGLATWLLWPSSDDDGRVRVAPGRSAATATAPPSRSSTVVPAEYGGTWRGALTTSSGNWTISVTLQGGTTSGNVQYYRDGKGTCAGTLSFTSFTADKVTMRESTPGCETTSGIVTLSLSGESVLGTWYSTQAKFNAGSPAYTGLLSKS